MEHRDDDKSCPRHVRHDAQSRRRTLGSFAPVFQREIHGSTVGLWGYGGIGRETARLARRNGNAGHVLTRSGVGPIATCLWRARHGRPGRHAAGPVFRPEEKEDFLRGLDFLILAMPQTKITEGLIGERELRALPRIAFLLNPARGPDYQARSAAPGACAKNGSPGAALDTHYHYPMPPDHPSVEISQRHLNPAHFGLQPLEPKF